MVQLATARPGASEAGIAYVAILFLLVVLVTLGLTFMLEAGTRVSAMAGRAEAMQAHYLAEAAANHAVWRLLNEPGFPMAEDVYYMHSLAGGRYGYKVKRPTATTFAATATVGVSGQTVARQSYVQYIPSRNIMTAYGQNANLIPQHRRLVGASFDAARDTVNIGNGKVRWMVLEACPARTEMMLGALDDEHDINVAVWNGQAWGNRVEVTTEAKREYQSFDVAYESVSGDALVVYRSGNSSTSRYRTWDGSSWSFSSSGPDSDSFWVVLGWIPGGGGPAINYIIMESKPGSNEILMAVQDDASDVLLWRWNGTSFPNFKYTIETDVTDKSYQGVDIAYEQQSEEALIVWVIKGSPTCKYRVWDGAILSPEGALPSFGKEAVVIQAAADPNSDQILVAASDNDADLNVALWDGAAWVDSRELETDIRKKDMHDFDIAWESSGNQAMVAWGSNAANKTNIHYFLWTKGTPLSAGTLGIGPSFLKDIPLVRLLPIAGTEKIVLLVTNTDKDLRYSLWTGNRFLGDPAVALETEIPYDDYMPFAVAGSE